MTIKVGVIGCGKIGQLGHLSGYKTCPNVEIVAVADVNEAAAKDAAAKFNVPQVFTDYRDLLKVKEIDAVSIGVPNFLHAEITIAACNAGKHVLVEKPMATTIQEAWEMVKAADKNKVIIMLAHAHRFVAAHQVAKDILASGLLGRINTITGHFGSVGPEFWSPEGKWFFDKKRAMGGAMADLGIHEIDLIRWLVGSEVKKVSGFVATHEKQGDVDDSGVCSFLFENGTLGMMYASWTYKFGGQQTIIYCQKGTMYIGKNPQYHHPITIELMEPRGILLPEIPAEPATGNRYQHFIHCVETGEKPIANGMEGLRSLEVILGVYKSFETNSVVDLPFKI